MQKKAVIFWLKDILYKPAECLGTGIVGMLRRAKTRKTSACEEKFHLYKLVDLLLVRLQELRLCLRKPALGHDLVCGNEE